MGIKEDWQLQFADGESGWKEENEQQIQMSEICEVEHLEKTCVPVNGLNVVQREIVQILYIEGKGTQQIFTELREKREVEIATLLDELFRLEQMRQIYHKDGYYYRRES